MRAKSIAAVFVVLLSMVFAGPSLLASDVLNVKTLKAGLRTATIEEGNFIERVVAMVKDGNLPPELVESTFQWARKKPDYRFQYFKRGLTIRAAKLGITL